MNQVKWRNRWRCVDAQTSGYIDNVHREFAEAQALAERSNRDRYGYQYWVEPIPEPPIPPPPKPPETSWRLHWRGSDGNVGSRRWRQEFDSVKADCDHLNRMDAKTLHWFQPHDRGPALKPGTDRVRWRIHYRNPRDLIGSSFSDAQPTMAKARAVLERDRMYRDGTLEYWIQPELAQAEPDDRLLGCRATAFSAFELKLAEAKPKPKPTLHYCGVEVRGSIIPGHEPNGQPVQWNNQRYQGGTTLITVKSRNLADALDAARADQEKFPDWKCWIQAIEPTVKPEPCHAIWKVWCQQRTGGTIGLASSPHGVILDREAAEKLAEEYNTVTQFLRYWAQPACEEAKAPGPIQPETLWRVMAGTPCGPRVYSIGSKEDCYFRAMHMRGRDVAYWAEQITQDVPETLYQVWGQCPDGAEFKVDDPTPFGDAHVAASRLRCQSKLGFHYMTRSADA